MLKHVRLIPALLCLGMLVIGTSAFAQEPEPEVCQIERSTNECGPVELCGPEGNYAYAWTGPGLPEEGVEQRCIVVEQDGTYMLATYNFDTQIKGECEATVEIKDCTEPPECDIISREGDLICEGTCTELCGPEGFEYLWSGPGVEGATTRCVEACEAGTYELTITDPSTKESDKCSFDLKTEPCESNCPRTPGYWLQQATQRDNGSTKFSLADIIAIAECIDARVDYFSWPGGNGSRLALKDVLTAGGPGWTQKDQAARHLAALVANVCASGYTPTHGGDVFLSESTVYNCNGTDYTIGELIDMMDDALQADDGYHDLAGCLDAINNGRGIGEVCDGKKEEARIDLTAPGGLGSRQLDLDGAQLYRPYPNPFTGTMRMSFAVKGSGEMVDIGVYDIAGRLVQKLASGFQSGGVHEVSWNGRDARGGKVDVGVYFVRGLVGQTQVNSRVVLTQ